jgi:hypothetical protein
VHLSHRRSTASAAQPPTGDPFNLGDQLSIHLAHLAHAMGFETQPSSDKRFHAHRPSPPFAGLKNPRRIAGSPVRIAFQLLTRTLTLLGDEPIRLSSAVDRALLSYVRGQAVVCLVTGAGVGIVLALVQYPAALLLGLLAAVAQVIPYLGFTVAVVTIALVGLSVDVYHAVLGAAIYAAIDWATGTFITPRVMERFLKMHPFVVTVSVLAGAHLLGPAGALLALPGAAMLQALIEGLASPEEDVQERAG